MKPPQAVGGSVYGGRITVYGQPNTYSSYIDETVRPALSPIADSYRPHLLQIADDLASQLSPFA